MVQHAGLGAGRWQAFTLAEQLGNVGSEVDRAVRAYQRADPATFDRAFDRALELLDLTIADQRWRGHRLRELTRAREEFCRLFYGEPDAWARAPGLQEYFLYFGLAARKDR